MDTKQLKKLAKACREAGIKSYTSPEFSFTLTDDLPSKPTKAKAAQVYHTSEADIEQQDTWDSLSDEQKLFFSVNPGELEASSEDN